MKMDEQSYRLNLEYRNQVNSKIEELVQSFLSDTIGVIALSRQLNGYQHIVQSIEPELGKVLLIFVGINSETDALPIGRLREMWHPSTAALEDKKVETAEKLYAKNARGACIQILDILKQSRLKLMNPL